MNITTTKISRPPFMVIYGDVGTLKSTFASTLKNPVFIHVDDGLGDLGVKAFDICETYDALLDQLNYVLENDTGFSTLVVEHLDKIEKMLHQRICISHGVHDIGKIRFGEGYKESFVEMVKLLELLKQINRERKMIVCVIAHSTVVKFENPILGSYNKNVIDVREDVAKIFMNEPDLVGYTEEVINTKVEDQGFGKKNVVASVNSQYVLYLAGDGPFKAKNHFGLPAKMALNTDTWSNIYKHLKSKMVKPEVKEGEDGK